MRAPSMMLIKLTLAIQKKINNPVKMIFRTTAHLRDSLIAMMPGNVAVRNFTTPTTKPNIH